MQVVKKKRAEKVKVAKSVIREIEKVTLGHGKLQDFANLTNVNRETIRLVKLTGLASPDILEKIVNGLNHLKTAA